MLESSGQLGLVAGSHLALYGSSETGGQLVEGGGGKSKQAGEDGGRAEVFLAGGANGCTTTTAKH